MNTRLTTALMAAALLCAGAGCAPPPPATVAPDPQAVKQDSPMPTAVPEPMPQAAPAVPPQRPLPFVEPISSARSRVTKKTFGLKVSPHDSPVNPERFSGYHTGVDFETTPEEKDIDVPVYAACDGALALKKTATGYGGVAVQRCKPDGADVTVIYGHLRLASVTASVGQILKAGDRLGVLGTGYGPETDGERKHLHFGVHEGVAIDIKGYVSAASGLSGWLDPLSLIR